ncbi:hypothetical protein M1373_02655 [Candidatus Marsarchaeota archaeon]|nr:hypothetical protein [Candidatus Marsarchaeota archaeon]MCL5404664.1 hypothetical protein [Candidatus Marsarchaeota archaeon]
MKKSSLLIELAKEKKRNADDNLKFVKLRAEWIKRKSNKDWSKRQKSIIDSLYNSNRKLKLKKAKA